MARKTVELAVAINYLDQAIHRQQNTVRFRVLWSAGVFIVGILIIAVVQLSAPQSLKGLLSIGGGFVLSLSSFPIKDLSQGRDKVAALTFLRQRYERLAKRPESERASEGEKLNQLFWQLIDKGLGG